MALARAMVAALAIAGVIAGCGASERDQVQSKVEQFVKAANRKDYKTICVEVLAPALLEHLAAGGITCEQAMQIALGPVQKPTLSIGRIIIAGSHARVITLTSAFGQQGSLDAIELIKIDQGWRVSSLGSPVVKPQVNR